MIRPVVILGLLAFLATGSGALSAPQRSQPTRGIPFAAVADAYVTSSAPRRNFGRTKVLRAQSRPAARSYLSFKVTGVDAPVASAFLEVYTRKASPGFTARASSASWKERRITYRNAPRTGRVAGRSGRVPARTRLFVNVTPLVKGNGTVSIALTGSALIASRESGVNGPRLWVKAPPPILLAAGDIASCTSTGDEATAALVKDMPTATVAALGDLAYENGTPADFASCYDPSWGRFKARTRPVSGNRDYVTPGAAGYFGYWGAAAGNPAQGWYSYDLGGWHVIALNSSCMPVGGCQAGSPQETWLRADLAAHRTKCTLAYWHHPLFSGTPNTAETDMIPIWQDLYHNNADLVLTGHAHNYQRFAPQTAQGVADPARGIREFVVGTGGRSHQPGAPAANMEVFNQDTYGVLRLILRNSGYTWQFLPIAGQTFTDSGSQACH